MTDLLKQIATLEDEISELKMNKRFSKETILFNTLQEIYEDCVETLRLDEENQRFNFESIDFRESIKNLKKFIEKANKDNKLRLIKEY